MSAVAVSNHTSAHVHAASPGPRTDLEIFSSLAEGLCGLPAVATLDWCDRAAACFVQALRPCVVSLHVATLGRQGELLDLEAVGLASDEGSLRLPVAVPTASTVNHAHLNGHHNSASAAQASRVRATPLTNLRASASSAPTIEIRPVSFQTPQARLSEIRCHAETLHTAGFAPEWSDATGTLNAGYAMLSRLSPAGAWRATPLGRVFSTIDASDVHVAVAPLGSAIPGRALILALAPTSGSPYSPESLGSSMRAALSLLSRRAVMALGAQRSRRSLWISPREQRVLDQLILGKSVRQIADDLDRSPHTVHDHVKSLHRKLNASSRGELIARALGYVSECTRIRESSRPIRRDQTPGAVVPPRHDEDELPAGAIVGD
ncbi:MAG: helix-turn-helix transcriptional regulator [Planctomycetota bacterium]|nr:helix-turn-helix transcriptional regulator [Planctomycetota bacterium]